MHNGNTHIFYRIFTSDGIYPNTHSSTNNIFHLDLSTNTDTLFLFDGGSSNPAFNHWTTVEDYSFWNNDPSKYIYCGSEIGIDPIGYVKRYDQQDGFQYGFGGFNVDISRQNDSLLFVNLGFIFISTDGGINWNDLVQQADFNFISLSPFNDNIMFGYGFPGELLKSTDRGVNYTVVDTFKSDNSYSTEFYYDSDGNHLYRTNRHYPQYYLSMSDNFGEPFSWSVKYTSDSPIHFKNDTFQSGVIYLADGKKILRSTDYGNTFTLYKELDKKIIGIYKKPNSSKLYAASKYKIYEITNDTISVIKSLPIPQEILDFYPLEVGNRWVYDYSYVDWNMYGYNDIYFREVQALELKPNGKYYFKIREKYNYAGTENTVFERIDTVEGKVYRYDGNCPNFEQLIEDLVMEAGDSTFATRFGHCIEHPPTVLDSVTNFSKWGFTGKKDSFISDDLTTAEYKLLTNIGLDFFKFSDDNDFRTFILKGMVKNGFVYGDTTLTDVDDENELPKEFSLSQNYPNPFNPVTTIKLHNPNPSCLLPFRKGEERGGVRDS